MRYLVRLLGLFAAFTFVSIFTLTAHAEKWSPSRLKDAVDVFFTAVGSQSLDPGLSTALTAAPGVARTALIERCQVIQQQIVIEEMDPGITEARKIELEEKWYRVEAVYEAVAKKNSTKLDNYEKDRKQRELKRQQQTGGSKKKKNKPRSQIHDELRIMIDEINRIKGKIVKIENENKNDINAHIRYIQKFQPHARQIVDFYNQLTDLNDEINSFNNNFLSTNPCSKIEALEKRIKAYSVHIFENEKKYRHHIDLAQKRLAICSGDDDIKFIKAQFDAAVGVTAQMEKDFQHILEQHGKKESMLDEANRLIQEFNQKNKIRLQAKDQKYKQLIDETEQMLEKIKALREKLEKPKQRMIAIKAEISGSWDYYKKRFPKMPKVQSLWKALAEKADNLILDIHYEPGSGNITSRAEAVKSDLNKIRKLIESIKKARLKECVKDPDADKAKDAVNLVRLRTFSDLSENEDIRQSADACRKKTVKGPQKGTGQKKKKKSSQVTPPPVQTGTTPQTPAGPKTPPANSGGLRIVGKATLFVADGAQYIGTDGAGVPYTGGVTWISSVDTVFVIGALDGHGKALKAGSATIIAHKEDMHAFFDVTVLARVPNLVGKTLQQAAGMLVDLGLRGSLSRKISKQKNYKVTSQSKTPGTVAEGGTTVVLEVAEIKINDVGADPDNEDSRLAGVDCSRWPGSRPVWDEANNRPACACLDGLVLNKDKTRCVDKITAILEKSDCGYYPNTRPVWDYDQDRVRCDCLAGYVWNQDRSACVDPAQPTGSDTCEGLRQAYMAAFVAHDFDRAGAILGEASGCAWRAQAMADFNYVTKDPAQIDQSDECREIEARINAMASSVPRVNIREVDSLYQYAKSRGCRVSLNTIKTMTAALDRQRETDMERHGQTMDQIRLAGERNKRQQQEFSRFWQEAMTQIKNQPIRKNRPGPAPSPAVSPSEPGHDTDRPKQIFVAFVVERCGGSCASDFRWMNETKYNEFRRKTKNRISELGRGNSEEAALRMACGKLIKVDPKKNKGLYYKYGDNLVRGVGSTCNRAMR